MPPSTSRLAGPKANILLVDDQPANLLALEAILDDLGQNLVRAHSGEEALGRLLQDDFAVVLLDIQMAGMDGFATAQLIRQQEKTRRTPIIFLTAYECNRLSAEEAYNLGAVDYLVKPLVPVILKAKVAGFIELFQQAEQIKRQAEQIRHMERRDFERMLAQENARLRESEARKAAILETALDGIITMDHEGKILEFNPAAEKTFGFSRAQALGSQLSELIIPPRLREQHRQGLAHYLATGEGPVLNQRIEMPAQRADGTEIPVELAIARISGEGPPVFTAYLRDLTDRKRTEHRRNARLAVTQILAHTVSLRDAAPTILRAICESLEWDVGLMWIEDPQGKVLRCHAVWHRASAAVGEFERVSRETTFRAGIGLPGRVWSSGQPAWICDVEQDSNFPRAPVARRAGLHGAFGYAIRHGTQILGVMEFFSGEVREPDPDLLEMVATLGGQVGQFMDRRRADEALQESEQRFARFMQHLPGLAWIKDLQGRYVYVNDAAEKVYRKPRAELYGKTDSDVFAPEVAAQFQANDRRALASETSVQVIETLEHEDGVLHYSLVSKFPILGPDGKAGLVGGMAIDITDRLRAEESLRQSEAQFRQLADALPQIVWTAQPDGFIDYYNERWYEFTGFERGQYGDPSWKPILHPDDVQRCVDTYYGCIRSGKPYQIEHRFIDRKTGGYRWFLGRAYPVRDAHGRIVRWFGTCTDIDDTKRAQEALRETDRRKDEFLAMLGHELRNPLAPVRNALQIMKLPGVNPEAVRQAREMMDRQIHHLVRLVDDLLDVSRIMRNRIELRKERLDLGTVVARAVETAQPAIDAQGHELSVALPSHSVLLHGDLVRLAQVVSNLLMNAAKYTDRAGRIWLTGELDHGEVVIRVRDTGIGIDPELQSHIFDLFAQAHRSLARSQGGLGVGLTVVKHLVEMHGGSVRARSSGPGQGSEFEVRLPALPPDPVCGDGPSNGEEIPSATSRRRVLIVDDNVDAAESTAMLLRLLGHEVETVHDGCATLEAVRTFQPEIVLLDIGLPGMTGYEVARALRSDPENRGLLLVAITGYGQDEDRRGNEEEAGFDRHLVKPVDPAAIAALLASLYPSQPMLQTWNSPD